MSDSIISHLFQGSEIQQRSIDGYIDATAMCDANGKEFADYSRLKSSQAFLAELSIDLHIPISNLVVTVKGRGNVVQQGTWVHPQVAINLGQWCSAKFAVWVSKLVIDWTTGKLAKRTPSEILLEQCQRLVDLERADKERERIQKLHAAKLESHAERIEGVESELGRYLSPHGRHYTIAGYASLIGVEMPLAQASTMGKRAAQICRTLNLSTGEIPDPRFGRVKTYPESVLQTLPWIHN